MKQNELLKELILLANSLLSVVLRMENHGSKYTLNMNPPKTLDELKERIGGVNLKAMSANYTSYIGIRKKQRVYGYWSYKENKFIEQPA